MKILPKIHFPTFQFGSDAIYTDLVEIEMYLLKFGLSLFSMGKSVKLCHNPFHYDIIKIIHRHVESAVPFAHQGNQLRSI